jgi:surface protein|tara:strand:+ start:917 stop:1954 length:1038 start_codon:yes stop_codon:yes gene_type:complete
MKKLLLLSAFLILACSSDYELLCVDEVSLSTLTATNITRTSATLNGVISTASINCDTITTQRQGFVYSRQRQPVIGDFEINLGLDLDEVYVNTTIENLEPNTAYYFRTFAINPVANLYANKDEEIRRFMTHVNDEPTNCDVVYLGENGITIKACESATIGDVGTINGIEYTVVSELNLRQRIVNNADISSVCTSRVIQMEKFFYQNDVFSQDISTWDVSNVISMSQMFEESGFNQDISNWDVRNLTDMYAMFKDNSAFNQPLENWNVGNVDKMGRMFEGNSAFNQPINNWDVSNVDEMWYMFSNASNFNQPLGDWDVSNVMQCVGFSDNTTQWTLPQPYFTNCIP